MARVFKTMLSLPASGEEKTDRQFITSLARGLEVLRAFEPGEPYLGNQEIARRASLPKPTVARITHTLTTLGYLEYNPRLEKYSLGTPVLALGHAYLGSMSVTRIARPHMQELANHANISVALGNRDRLNLAYLELAHGSSTVALRLDVGARIPIARSAMGLAYLHALPTVERDFLVDAILKNDPDDASKFRKRLSTAFREIEATGFCVSMGVFDRTTNGAGAALQMREGGIFAFNCSGPSFHLTEERLRNDVGPRLVMMVRNIQAELMMRPSIG